MHTPSFPARMIDDRSGNVLAIAAAGMLVLAALVGSGVEMSRGYRAQNRLQAACDSGVLAGRRAVSINGFDNAAKDKATAFFNTNFEPAAYDAHDVSFDASSPDEGNTVEGVATASVDSTLMRIFGFNQFDFTVNCTASMGVGNSDVVMVLDSTGSMGSKLSGSNQTRIQALRSAMKNFYNTLDLATRATNARIRYGFVPYSSSVNVGQLLMDLDPDYIVDSWTIQSRQALYVEWGSAETRNSPSSSGSGSSCPSTSWTDTGTTTDTSRNPPTITQKQSRRIGTCSSSSSWFGTTYRYELENREIVREGTYNTTGKGSFIRWEYKPVTYDVSNYKTFSPTTTLTGERNGQPISQTSTWAGCIEERSTRAVASFSFSSLTGISPYVWDLDLDTPPDYSDPDSQWRPMWPEVAYRTNGSRASSSCPAPARLLEEMNQSEFNRYADDLIAVGNTYHDLGMIWGGRLSSPDGIFSANVSEDPQNGGEVSRHIIFMTDGVMEPSTTIQSSYGIETHDRRITSNGSSNQASRHTSRFLAICEAIKAKGIRIWVIAFTSGLSSDLTTCASDDSSFTANDADDLDEAFQEIAKQVGELRIIQ